MRHFCITILFFLWLVMIFLLRIDSLFHILSFFILSNILSPNLVLQTMMVWLWGINLWFFSQANVNYAKIFDLDQNHLTHREIWKVLITANAMTLSLFVHYLIICIDFFVFWYDAVMACLIFVDLYLRYWLSCFGRSLRSFW